MKRLLVALTVMAAGVFILAGTASAGKGTGITATPASTITWASTYTAQFVRSASGIINETNRVNSAGAQNGWSQFDVWLQFRPLTGPDGNGDPKPNPNCEGSTVTPPFTYINYDSAIGGDPTTGYFIGTNPYNVCVYYAHPFVLTLEGNGQTSLSVNAGDHVVYTGNFSNGSVQIGSTPVYLTVYDGTGCVGSNLLYANIPAGSTDGSGNYSYDGGPSPLGVYSVEASATADSTTATSNCIDIYVGETAAVYNVTSSPSTTWACDLGATGGTATSSTVYWYRNQVTGDVTATITVTGADPSSTFDVWIEQNPGTCPPGTNTPSNPAALTTDASGNGTATITFTPEAGATNFWLSLWTPAGSLTGTQVLRSVAVGI